MARKKNGGAVAVEDEDGGRGKRSKRAIKSTGVNDGGIENADSDSKRADGNKGKQRRRKGQLLSPKKDKKMNSKEVKQGDTVKETLDLAVEGEENSIGGIDEDEEAKNDEIVEMGEKEEEAVRVFVHERILRKRPVKLKGRISDQVEKIFEEDEKYDLRKKGERGMKKNGEEESGSGKKLKRGPEKKGDDEGSGSRKRLKRGPEKKEVDEGFGSRKRLKRGPEKKEVHEKSGSKKKLKRGLKKKKESGKDKSMKRVVTRHKRDVSGEDGDNAEHVPNGRGGKLVDDNVSFYL